MSRVLLVDDDAGVRSALCTILKRAEFQVFERETPFDALTFLESERVDAVVSDISMPGMSGVEMLARLREEYPHLPVVFLTGTPKIEDTIRAMELGAFRYLTKPVDAAALVRVAGEAVRWGKLLAAGAEGPGAASRLELEASFTAALQGLYLAFQPIIAATTRKVVGWEALMRSTDATLPTPLAVLDAAEKLGRLHLLGRHVRRLTAAQIVRSLDPAATMFVNLHAADLGDSELYEPDAPLSAHASSVVLEITERSSLEGHRDLEGSLAALRALGYRIAVDDLGAGHAGLGYFARLNPEIVKIDMSLTRDVDADPVKQRVIASMCSLAKELGIVVVVEGIESDSEMLQVIELGANLLQGFAIGHPGPLRR